ncbi:MAG: AI-2E family transporter, partial [Clostridia bacterium]
MKSEWKKCFRVGITLLVVFVILYNLEHIGSGISLLAGALTPLAAGCIIAYLINIPMSFYERYYFRNNNSPWVRKSRRAVCLIGAVVTLLLVVFLVIRLIVPELVSCIRLLVDALPGALEKVEEYVKNNEFLSGIFSRDFVTTLSDVDWQEFIKKAADIVSKSVGGIAGSVTKAAASLFSGTTSFIIGFIFAIYLLVGKERLAAQLKRVM